jgi:hypothetical protein
MQDKLKSLLDNREEFLRFLKSKAQLFHLSNVFFRDFQYGIISYAENKGWDMKYGAAEELAKHLVVALEQSGILKPVKPGSWMLNYPEFRTPASKREPPAKPTPSAAAAKPAQSSAVPASSAAASSTTVASNT